MENLIQKDKIDSAYQDLDCNKDITKDNESRNGIMEERAIQMDVAYKKKTIKVRLTFSDDTNNENAKSFCYSLKKIYMGKDEFRAIIPELSALKCN